MRNLKRLLAVVLTFAMLFTLSITAFAADTTTAAPAKTDAQICQDLGMILGNGSPMADYLASKPTRLQGAIMFLRLKGLEADAKAFLGTDNFDDATGLNADNTSILAYLHAHPDLGYEGMGDNKFAPNDLMTAKAYYKVLLVALGYKYGTDFTWANVFSFAAGKGLSKLIDNETFTINDIAVGTVEALKLTPAGGTTNLLAALVAAGTIDAAAATATGLYTAVPVVTTVTAVKILNLKQLSLTFSAALDKTKAEDEANYKVYNGGGTTDLLTSTGTAALQDDGKTVLLTLNTNFNNGTTGKVVVSNIATYTNDALAVSDTTVPTIVGVSITGPKTITVEYSEPVSLGANPEQEYTIDDGNYIATSAVLNGTSKVDVTVGVNLTNGAHKIKFAGSVQVTDWATYRVVPQTVSFTVAADTSAPTVTVKSASPTQVKLTFSKPVNYALNGNVAYRHTFNSAIAQYQALGNDGTVSVTSGTATAATEVTINYSTKPIPLGNNNLYISYVDSSAQNITDLWGNKFAAVVLPISITMDTDKPAVKEVKFVDAQTLKVIFTEKVDVATATTTANYVVKDSSASTKSQNGVPTIDGTDTSGATVLLHFAANTLGGGSYTVAISNVKDAALIPNIMDAATISISATDTVKPTAKNGFYLIDASDANHQKVTVNIPFSEAMDAATLVKGNFMKNVNAGGFAALGDNDSITVGADQKSVTIVIDNAAVAIASIDILVGAVKDPAGNGLVTFTASVAGGQFTLTSDAIAVAKVEATAKDTLKVTFNGKLSSVTAAGFSFALQDGAAGAVFADAISVASNTVNSDGVSEVVFTLGTSLTEDALNAAAGSSVQLVVNGATGTKSTLGTVVSNLAKNPAAATAGTIVDKIAPTVSAVAWVSATTITVTFNEALNPATVAATLNGFSVTNGTLASVALGGANKVITLTSTANSGAGDFVKGSTTVSYNSIAGLTDASAAGNKLADFSGKTAN